MALKGHALLTYMEQAFWHQAEVLKAQIRPMLRYLNRLPKRMIQRGFLNRDPLFNRVVKASNKLERYMLMHYLSCGDVVIRPRTTSK